VKLDVTCKNFKPTDSIKEKIKKKAEYLIKFKHGNVRVNWVCSVDNQVHKSEVSVDTDHGHFHASAEDDNLYKTFDEVIPKLEKQLSRKRVNRLHHSESGH
jgi:ribosomal subunit interface protein